MATEPERGLCANLNSSVCIVSVVRLAIYIKTLHSTDDTWFVLDGSIWTVIEANVGLICACMPALKALLHHCAPRFFSQISGYPSRGRSDRSDLPNSINDKPYHRYDEDSVELHQKQPRPMEVEVTTEVGMSPPVILVLCQSFPIPPIPSILPIIPLPTRKY